MTTDPAIVDALLLHEFYRTELGGCVCGWRFGGHEVTTLRDFNTHLAAVIEPLIAAREERLRAEVEHSNPDDCSYWYDFCRCGDVVAAAHRERDAALVKVREYEDAINWDTTCLNCSKLMDQIYELDQVKLPAALAKYDEAQAERDAALAKVGRLREFVGIYLADYNKAIAELDAERAKVARVEAIRDALDDGVAPWASADDLRAALAEPPQCDGSENR